ncbi:TetR/AcrR family transcriptional regulator [Actinophytocola oryzae]|uniref:TetR family transcriptional regulator n=1 Tax=Actinophytocola oryzae TaxID=502181 RepID=A0A4V6Q6L8_9PSEU|nr:TetR family transcriptional regulator C-terminal domain-containing protein [Actinophytocola oryzae]TDV43641.1 TetR family transcriptional regulator [Actinophytocola oryzae]
MPRKVDHHTRRAAIAESAWRLTSHGGIEAVTMRHVAADAGMSLGQVQHYFTTKDALLTFAYQLLTERITTRTTTTRHPGDEEPEPHDVLRHALVELLPLDEQRTLEAHVTTAYLAHATVTPDMAAQLRKTHTTLENLITHQLRRGQHRGNVPVHLDTTRAARTLLALLDGLTAHVLIGTHTPTDAEHALDTHLDELFTT